MNNVKNMTLEELQSRSDELDRISNEERQRLKDIHDGGYYFIGNGSGLSYLSSEDAQEFMEVNSELDRRKRELQGDPKKRIFIKRKLRRAGVGFNPESTMEELEELLTKI